MANEQKEQDLNNTGKPSDDTGEPVPPDKAEASNEPEPADKAESSDQPEQSESAKESESSDKAKEPDKANGKKPAAKPDKPNPAPVNLQSLPVILIADGNNQDTEIIRKTAEAEGCQVITESSMSGIIAAIDRLKPILVFIARDTPRLNLSLLCRKAQQRNTAIVFQGKFKTSKEVIAIAKLGVVDIMAKPLSPDIVVSKVLNALAYAKKVLHRTITAQPITPAEDVNLEEKVRKMLEATRDIMVMPHTATRMIALCGQQNTNIEDLTKTAASDPAISMMLFRRANSAAYGSATPAKTLRDAIVRIGYRTVRAIVTITAVYKLSGNTQNEKGFNRIGHWIHSLAVGVLAESAATAAKFAAPEDAFLAGVLHDFGKLVFDDYMPKDYAKVMNTAQERNIPVRQVEIEYFKKSHETVGGELSRNWKLPGIISEAIQLHHDDDKIWNDTDSPACALARFVRISDHTVRAMMLGYGGDMYATPVYDKEWRELGMHETNLSELCASAIRRVSEIVDWLGVRRDRITLPAPPSVKDRQAWILDGGGNSDRMLDIFATALGYDPIHAGADTAPEGTPAFMLWDFREKSAGTENISETWKKQPDIPIFVLGDAGNAVEGLSKEPVIIPDPLDFITLSQAILAG